MAGRVSLKKSAAKKAAHSPIQAKQFIRNWFKQRGRESNDDAFLKLSRSRFSCSTQKDFNIFQNVFGGFVYVCLHFGPLEHSRIPLSADLTFGHLASLRGSAGEKTSEPGVFDSNGADKQRIRNVLRSQKDCGCKCKRK